MAINNDRNLLEQQILSNSGLKGKELENLKARLATLSEQQLQAELSKSLSGNNKGEWYTGVMLEHNESVIMRNNHDQTTYTDDNGNEISELKDGDEVLERTIKSTDDKGNVFETTVTFSGGRPLTQTKSKNGNTTETTTYKYNDDADVPFVTVETKKADQSKVMTNVLEIDENGNFDNEDFIDRQTTSMDGTTTHIFTENNCVIEQQVKPNGKKVDTIYKGDSIDDYDNKKLHRVYQRTELKGEVHEVAYDGNGNTRTVVQNGESPSAIARKFGVKESSLRKLNPARGKNAITQVGADIVVPGEYNADARVMTRRKSKQGAMQDFANDEVQRTAERLYSSTMQEVTLDKDYKDAYSYARALLAADGVKNPSNHQVNNKANEILVANGNIKFKKGTKVQIAAKTADSKFVTELSNNGFKPTRENAIFYNRFNALNPTQQQNVLSVIKYCKTQNITDPNKIKARILETFPEINLFDSGKTIPQNNFTTPAYQRKNPVALETFLTETLKLDLKSDVGRTVYERLVSLPQDELNKINAQNFSDMSKANFNDIANHIETSGVNIRTQMENQIEQANRDHRAEMLGIPQQKFTSEMLANIYDRAADMMEEYYHNHGVFDAGTYLEGYKNLMDWITPDNLFGIDMRSTLHVASDCRKAAQRFRQMHTDNPETFKREYAQLKKDGLVTADYNQQNVQEFMNLIQSGDVDINSDKFKNACKKAFGFKGVENTEKYIQTGQMAGNIGDIAVMLYTLGAASELKMMGKATQGVYGALEKGAGKFMSKTAAQKTAKIGTSMAMGGTTLGGFTLGKETLNNLSNPMRDATSFETWKETGIASAESFGFGAFGGLLNETVVVPIVKAIEKPATKATQAVSKALTEQGELTGKQIMQTVSESGGLKLDGLFKMNSQELANFARTATAKGVGFGAEVTGFTAYEAGLDIIKDLIDPQTGRLPENITVDSLTEYLGEKFGEQFSNLGTIKGVSQLLMMSKGGKVAQKAMMNEILSKSDALKDIKFKKAEINGHEVYEVTYPNGNRAVVSSPEQAIATCQMAMQMEFLAKSLTEGELKSEITRPRGMNAQENIDISKKHIESNEIDLDELLNGNPIDLLNNENDFNRMLALAKEQGKEKEYIAMYRQALKDSEKIDEILEDILSKDQNLNALYNTNKEFASRINEIVNYGYYCKFNAKTGEKITNNVEYIKSLLHESVGKIKDDVAKDKHYEEIINTCIDNPKSTEANKLYKQYLDEEFGTDTNGTFANVRNMCEKIHSDFGVKVFLPSDTKEAGVALKLVYQELSNFKMHAKANGEIAKLPEVINFSTTSLPSFIKGTASGYSQVSFSGTDLVFVKGLTIDQIKYVLRHELTHVNDKLSSNEFPSDIDVKKYAEELLNAGVDVEHISYAYVNRHEFLAVASEGDIRSYSNEFKSVLEKLGMPKFILNMQNMRLANKKVTENEKKRLNQIMENIENEVKQYDKSNNGNFQVSTMSDAEFATQCSELCRRSDGAESPAARALLEAVINSELSNKSYDVKRFKLDDFKGMTRDYQGNLYSEEMLGYAKEIVECIPKGKDDDLLTSTDFAIRSIIDFQLDHAKPEVRRWIVDATKKLMSNPHVRNGIVDDIIKSCTEGNYKEGYTFNQKAFDRIYQMFEKKTVDGYEVYQTKNREWKRDYSYSLMVAEIAQNGLFYEKNANGDWEPHFDDIGFKIGLALPASDPHDHYVHYHLRDHRETEEINLYDRDPSLQSYIIQETERKHFQSEVEKREYNLRTYKYDTWIEHDEYAEPLRQLCMVNGKPDVQNCFAVDFMREDLGMWKDEVLKVMQTCRNKNGVLDMTMLRLIKNEEQSYGRLRIRKNLERLGQDINILYDENGHINQETLDLLKNSSKAFWLSKIKDESWYNTKYSYDISQHYMVDGKIDLEKLKMVETEIEDLAKKLGTDWDRWNDRCALSNLYNIMKANPKNAQQILDKAIKVGKYILNTKISDKDGKGLDLSILDYYASLPDDLCNVMKGDTWLEPFVTGKPLDNNTHYNSLTSRLKPEVKETLAKHGIDINYVLSAKENQSNKKTEVNQQTQMRFEQAIESLDKTLATADISRGIELEYSREQFEKDIFDVIKNLPQARANDLLNSYGLTLRDGKIEGVICEPKVQAPQGLAQANQRIREIIEKFQNNKVTTQDPALNSLYTALTADFPEFSMLVGKVGKNGQRVDTTILKQIQTLINNPQYKSLSPKEQKMAKLVLLFRGFDEIDSNPDVIRKTFMIDNDGLGFNITHKRYKNSEYTAAILERFNLTEAEKYALSDLVGHSGWSEEFNGGIVDRKIAVDKTDDTSLDPSLQPENNVKKVAVNTRFGTLKLSKLIEDVINPDNNVDTYAIEQMQKQVYQNMQVVNSVSAKDLEPYWETQIIDGVECQVIDLRKTKLPDNFYLMGHFTQHGVDQLYDLLSNTNDKAFFSNSLIKPNAAKTFAGRTEGIISEFDNRNVAETCEYNIDSGFGKSYNSFVTTMAGRGSRTVAREVKEKLNLTNEEYGLLMEQIVDKRLNELDEYYDIGGKRLSKQEIVNAHNEAYESMLKSQGEQNEITILNQKPIAYAYSASRTYQGLCPFNMKDNPLKRVIIFP